MHRGPHNNMADCASSGLALLGRGALSRVYLSADGLRAIKQMPKALLAGLRVVEAVLLEKEALRLACECDQPCRFIAKYVGAMQSSDCLELHAEAVLYNGLSVSVRDVARTHPAGLHPAAVSCLIAGTAAALAHLHGVGVVHRDVKPENLVIGADGLPRLVDFGSARVLGPTDRSTSLAGTVPYLSPEMLCRAGHSHSTDWWSLGVLTCAPLRAPSAFKRPACLHTPPPSGARAGASCSRASRRTRPPLPRSSPMHIAPPPPRRSSSGRRRSCSPQPARPPRRRHPRP